MLILSVGYSGTRFSSRQSTYRWFTGSPLSTTWVLRTANHRIIGSWPFAPASSRVAFPTAFIKTDTFEEACTEAVGPEHDWDNAEKDYDGSLPTTITNAVCSRRGLGRTFGCRR
jgi:hypothetical protein